MKDNANPQDLATMICGLDRLQSAEHSFANVAWSRNYSMKYLATEITPSRLDAFIIEHLHTLANFTTARYKWTREQLATMAWLIRKQQPYLTFPQFQHFIVCCMAGRYGKFYDKLDAVELLTWLHKYLSDIDQWRRANWDQRPPAQD